MMINMSIHAHDILKPHSQLIDKILKGQTPFRDMRHAITCYVSKKLNLKLDEEEEAFKKSIL